MESKQHNLQMLDMVQDEQIKHIRVIFAALFEIYDKKLTTLEKIENITNILEKAVGVKGGGDHGTV